MDLAYLPSPSTGVLHLGPVPLRAYAFCIILGVFAAVWLGNRRWVARGGEQGVIADVTLWAVPFGLVGGRLYHVFTSPDAYFGERGEPVRALYVWEGGLGIWGAIALGAVGAWIGCRRHRIPLPAFADTVAPGIVLAQAIGLGPGDRPCSPSGRHARHRDVSPHLPLRIPLEHRRRRTGPLGGETVPARSRQDLRPLRRRLHGRPVLDRVPAHRRGPHVPRWIVVGWRFRRRRRCPGRRCASRSRRCSGGHRAVD